ncbi:hypothetical protein AVEN_16303-1 [Araneus ventricosus]|uniref:Uncharacterized protein n=1 Tax=Araneus ventricosus TaxID=182803 RepID=A0A4Y2LN95_ARAVE|nr:hypothetical protein AVEN_16303-1 [Araneus ventricosus]
MEWRQVPVTTKRTPLNDNVTVVQDGSFGRNILGSRTDLHKPECNDDSHIYFRDVILEQHTFTGAPWKRNFCLWMTTLNYRKHCGDANVFNRRISPVWISQYTHRT